MKFDPVLNSKELCALYRIRPATLSKILHDPLCPLRARRGNTGRIIEVRHTPELAAFITQNMPVGC